MTRIANSASTTQLVNLLLRSQQEINKAQIQLTSDKVSQNYAGIARESERLVGLENSTSLIERFTRNNELMDLRLQLTETALGGIEKTIDDFRRALLDFSNLDKTNEEDVASMQSNAWRSLRSLSGHLNTDVNGEFLFAGSRTTTQPVDFGIATLGVLQDTWNGDSITYPTDFDNNVHPRLNAWSGSPDDPDNTGFGRLSFSGGLGGTITSDTAGYQTDTITLAGTVQNGDQYKVTVDGTTLTYTVTGAEADLAAVRTNIITALNLHPVISPLVNATAGGANGEIILTADTPGTTFTTSVTASNLPPIAQIDTITITGTPQVGDQYTLTVDGTLVTYTATGNEGTLAGLRTAITAAINGNATIAAIVTATDSAVDGEIYLTATATNTAFATTLVGATDIGDVAQVETVTISTGSSEAGDVFTTTVGGVAYPYTTVGAENQDTIATGLAAEIDANPALSASAVGAVITITADVAGTPYTSASTVVTDAGGVADPLTATDAVTQANIVANPDNTASVATTQAAEAGIQPAIAQVDNVTLTGTFVASDTIAINIDGLGAETYTVTGNDLTVNGDGTGGVATAAQARTNIATKVAAAIADNPTLSAVATATSSSGAVILTAVNAGTAFTTASSVVDATSSGNGQTSAITTPTANFAGGIPAIAQIDNVTLTGVFDDGQQIDTVTFAGANDVDADLYTTTVDGVAYPYTATVGDTPTDVAAGMAALINANPNLTATNTLGVVTIKATVPGTAFANATTVVTDTGANATAMTATDATPQPNGVPDTISVDVGGTAIVYTVVPNDMTADGAGAGTATQAQYWNNISTKVAAAVNGNSTLAAVVTAAGTSNGSGVITLTADTANLAFTTITSATTVGTGATAATTPTAAAAAINTNADNAVTLQSVSASTNPFANIPVGATITIAGASNSANNTTYTVAANTGTVITVASTQTVVSSGGSDTSSTLTISSDISYYRGDEIARTHQTSKTREFSINTTAIDPAIEKAVRAMFIVAQGVYGTDGGLDKNQGRIEDALYLVRSALNPNIGGTPPYGTESTSNLETVRTNIAYNRILIDQTNIRNQELVDFFDMNVIEVENIDQLAVITKLLDDQQALEASYQSMARIRKLSLVNFL